MSEDKPRLARLTALLTQLQSKQLVTATEMAEKHQVSVRTIYRDIRTLEQSGVPIATEEGKGYSIVEGYKLPPVMFTEAEANALVTVEQLILKNNDHSLLEHYQNAVTKIKSTLKFSQQAKAEFLVDRIQIRDRQDQDKTSHYLIQLQSAIVNFQIMKLDYLSLDEVSTERRIEPFALYTTNGHWILIAFCQKRNDFRAFRLDRIQGLKGYDEHFESHKMTLEEYLEECRKKWEGTPDIPLTQGQ